MASIKFTQAVEAYFTDLRLVRGSGGATNERSLYVPLANLLNAVGSALRPKVFCVQELAEQGVGHPDFGLYTTQQVPKGKPKSGQKPERGVIEVKPVEDDAWLTAESNQVAGYWQGYRQVMVTNGRDFVLVGEDVDGSPVRLESLRLADSAAQFDAKLEHPRAFSNEVGPGLGEYLTRVLSHSASLAEPKDVAWLLASYARDGLARVEKAGDASSLATLRQALEESLGVKFDGEQGAAFFRSTLVQTLQRLRRRGGRRGAGLSQAYRTTKQVRRPEGQGLNDLYVRFFRMAERRIAEKTGQGVVCFISNYSWLDGLSFTGMRERYLEAFDTIRIDCLNGDKYRTGKTTPEGAPDPSIFSTPEDPVGIQVGTAIATLVRRADHVPAQQVDFRHLWGHSKHSELGETAESAPDDLYGGVAPLLSLGLPFADLAVSDGWQDWPALPDLFPTSFPGVKTSRDGFLVDVDLDRLKQRMADYFDANLGHEEIARRYPGVMRSTARFDARAVRDAQLKRGGPADDGFVRYAYRPLDTRWLYWEGETKLLDEKRADYKPHVFEGNSTLVLQRTARPQLSPPLLIRELGDLNEMNSGIYCVPVWLRDDGFDMSDHNGTQRRPNLSASAEKYLENIGTGVEDLFHHTLAVLHDPKYHEMNGDALRMEWPRIPLPDWPDGVADNAADALTESAAWGRKLAALLDSDTAVAGVTTGTLRPELACVAVPATTDGGNMAGDDFTVSAGWGHFGTGEAVMPGQGRVFERDYTAAEWAALGDTISTLGGKTFDVYLNERAYWRNVPAAVWDYQLGGYQVLKSGCRTGR